MSGFRDFLYPPGHPRIEALKGMDAYEYSPLARHDEFTGGIIDGWKRLYGQPFRGVTTDGTLHEDLFNLEKVPSQVRAPIDEMVEAAVRLLETCSSEERDRLVHAVDAPEWQSWANPEFIQFDTGLRLEFTREPVREAFMDLVEASTSPSGYAAIRTMMRINDFLGKVLDLPGILNEWSYNVALYGEPSLTAPWGWQLFGHHCAVNVLIVDGQMVLSPVFLGAEPNEIDEGPYAGTIALRKRIRLGREIMAALTPDQRSNATVYAELVDPAMPEGRVHPGDERHLAGAFQDNRIIAEEGVRVREFSSRAQQLVWNLVEDYVGMLPSGPAERRMAEIRAHLDQTWFSWIGGRGPDDPYYLRIQSPVVIIELDHHCGVFLTNDSPQPFHIHTVMRTPNGNDYGRALVREWQATHSEPGRGC